MNSRPKKDPSKKGILSSTPAVKNTTQFGDKRKGSNDVVPTALFPSFVDSNLKNSKEKNMKKHHKVSYIDWICEAIEAVGLPKKGASFIAIKKWILGNKEYGASTNQAKILKKTVVKGLIEGVLKRPKRSVIKPSAVGSYLIAKVHEIPKKKNVSSKKTAKVASELPNSLPESATLELNHLGKLNDSNVVEVRRRIKVPKSGSFTDDKDEISNKELKVPKSLKNATKSKEPASTSKSPAKSKAASKGLGKSKEASKDPGQSKEASKDPGKSKEAAPVPSKAPAKSKQKTVSKLAIPDESKVKTKPPRAIKLPKKGQVRSMRKDLSDTELDVKRTPRKSLKSYSSDTEIDFMIKNSDSTIASEKQSEVPINKTRKIKKT